MESATNDVHDKNSSPRSSSFHLLLNSDSTTTSVPLHDCIEHSQDYANGMWHPSHTARSASLVATSTTLWRAQANGYSSHARSSSIHVSQTSLHADDDSAKLPVLRWFRATHADQHADHSPSSTHSHSPSVSRTPSPTSPSFALREALNDTIAVNGHDAIQRPQPARLPSAFSTRSSIRRSPPFLENLARSTLPTASLTRPLPTSPHPLGDSQNDVDSTAIIISQSPPSRTSIDSLRSLRDRGMGVTPKAARTVTTSATTSWWWYMREHKSSVDDLLDESDQAGTVEDEAAKIRRKYKAPKNPVVFCHGLLGFDSVSLGPAIAPLNVSHWRGIQEVLEARGIEVLVTRVPATSSPMDRAKVLEEKVSEAYPGRSVHLVGHSMGGLDCRYLTTHLKHRKFRVLSITTVATPHRGSSFADHFIASVGKERMPQFVSLLDLLPNGGGDGKAFESLTVESMRKFNEETPNVEGVKYFSWGAVFEPGLLDAFKWSHSVILQKEGPNDGLVSVASSKWGTYLGTLEDVSHLDLIGWINMARYKWAELTGREIKFKPATFYLGVADHLARVVEGLGECSDENSPERSKGTSRGESEEGNRSEQRQEARENAEGTRAGEGVKTTEGVEHKSPKSTSSSSEDS